MVGGLWRRFQESDELESLAPDDSPGRPDSLEPDDPLESEGWGSPIMENEDALLADGAADEEEGRMGRAFPN